MLDVVFYYRQLSSAKNTKAPAAIRGWNLVLDIVCKSYHSFSNSVVKLFSIVESAESEGLEPLIAGRFRFQTQNFYHSEAALAGEEPAVRWQHR